MITYTNPKNGQTISTDLIPSVARLIIQQHAPANDSFAHDLTRKVNISQAQAYWLMVKAEKYNPANKDKPIAQKIGEKVGEGFKRIQEMFAKAKETLLRPKIKLQNNGDLIQLSLAPDTGRNIGHIYVKTNGEYAGKISPEGDFFPVPSCSPSVKDYIKSFAENPEGIAAAYGHATGNCCFCSKLLTDERSTSVGYGPICSAKYGLAWG